MEDPAERTVLPDEWLPDEERVAEEERATEEDRAGDTAREADDERRVGPGAELCSELEERTERGCELRRAWVTPRETLWRPAAPRGETTPSR